MLIIVNDTIYPSKAHKDHMARLIVVNVDELILTRLAVLLETNEHQLVTTYTDKNINAFTTDLQGDVVIGRISSPKYLLRFASQYPRIPVLVIAEYPTVTKAVDMMRAGASDYLPLDTLTSDTLLDSIARAINSKDFWSEQLKELNHAAQIIYDVLSQTQENPEALLAIGRTQINAEDYPLQIRDLILYPEENEVSFRNRRAALSPTEYMILAELARNTDRVVTFEELALKLRGVPILRNQARRMFSAHISNLRQKLEQIDCHYIVNKRGEGYYLSASRNEQPGWNFAQLQWMTDHSLDVIAILDIDYQYSYISPSVTTILGYEEEHFVGQRAEDLLYIFHPDDRQRMLQWLANPKQIHLLNDYNWRLRHIDDDYRWIEMQANSMFDDNAMLVRTVMFWRDVTQRRDSELFLETVVNNVGLLISRFDTNLMCVFVNLMASQFKLGDGYLQKGKYLGEMNLPSEMAQKWETIVKSTFQTGQLQRFMFLNGTNTLETRFIPEFDVDNHITHVLCITSMLSAS